MKKKILIFLSCVLFLLAGCAKKADGERMTLGGCADVSFTGTYEDGIYTGTAEGNGWQFDGTLTADAFLDGAGESVPCKAVSCGSSVDGTFTGSLVSGSPDGDGTFVSLSGGTFTGEFSLGTAVSGEAADFPIAASFNDDSYSGGYTGSFVSSVPEGNGIFRGANHAGSLYIWDGEWSGGIPSGSGQLTNEHFVVTLEGTETAGLYNGDGKDGIPSGNGTFSGADANDISFRYTGEWSDGCIEGQGVLTYNAQTSYTRTGTFHDGYFSPTWMETLLAIGTYEPEFTLTQAQTDFLQSFPDLSEREDHQNFFASDYKSLVEHSASIASCFSDDSFRDEPYWMEVYSMGIVASRTFSLVDGGYEMTYILAVDRSYTYPCIVIVPGNVDRATQNNSFHIYAVPLFVSSYVNSIGTERECLILLAGDIYTGM